MRDFLLFLFCFILAIGLLSIAGWSSGQDFMITVDGLEVTIAALSAALVVAFWR